MPVYTEDEENLITLCSLDEFSYSQRAYLLSNLKSYAPDFAKGEQKLIKTLTAGVYNKARDKFLSREYREKVFDGLEKRGMFCVTYASRDYPGELRKIPAPPITLFCRGRKELLKDRKFAIVGSRRTPPAYAALAKSVSADIARRFAVVTGTAEGADAAAVTGALATGNVICVLANGADCVYPACNSALLSEVAKKGLVISEYFPDVPVRSFQFPVRNRIIAGLAEAGLIVSAGEKSGALITAGYLEEYSKKIFAFPYQPNSVAGAGCNSLLKCGAQLCENSADISSVLGVELKKSGDAELSEREREVLGIIREAGEIFAGELAARLDCKQFELLPALSKLEIKGLIVRLGGNRYGAV